jgi:hypothetical protein
MYGIARLVSKPVRLVIVQGSSARNEVLREKIYCLNLSEPPGRNNFLRSLQNVANRALTMQVPI